MFNKANITLIGTIIAIVLGIFGLVGGHNQTVSKFGSDGDTNLTNLVLSGTANVTGSMTVDTNTLFVGATNNNVGVGTSSPMTTADFVVDGSATTTMYIGSSSATKGGCIQIDDNFGSTTRMYIKNGAPFSEAGTCR